MNKFLSIFLVLILTVSRIPVFAERANSISDTKYIYFENFKNVDISKEWESNIDDNLSISRDDIYNNCLKISSKENGCFVSASFEQPIIASRFTVEYFMKNADDFSFGFIDEDGKFHKFIGMDSHAKKIGCYTSDDSALLYSKNVKFIMDNKKWHKLKLTIDRTNGEFTVTMGDSNYTVQRSTMPGAITHLAFEKKVSYNESQMYIDNIAIYPDDLSDDLYNMKIDNDNIYETNGCIDTKASNYDGGIHLNGVEIVSDNLYNVIPDKGCMGINIDGDITLEPHQNVYVTVSYKDSGYGYFYLKYMTEEGLQKTDAVELSDSSEIITHTFMLKNVLFSDSCNGNDIALCTTNQENALYGVGNVRNYSSSEPVIVNGVRIYTDGKCSPISVNVDTGTIANIFYDTKEAVFDIEYINKSDTKHNFSVEYTAKKENSTDIIFSAQHSYAIESGKRIEDIVKIPIEDYGLYELVITVISNDDKIYQTENIKFANAVRNTELSNNVGINIHLAIYGDPDKLMLLIKNAGIGLVRDGGFYWNDYEMEQGVYALSQRKQQLLKAAQKYGIDVMVILNPEYNVYDKTNFAFLKERDVEAYKNYLRHFLNEYLIKQNVSKLQIMNEPNANQSLSNNIDRAKAVALMSKATKEVVNEIGSESYKIGVLSITGIYQSATKEFADYTFNNLNVGDFDTISMHPYMVGYTVGGEALLDDPEPGFNGTFVNSPTTSLKYQVDYYQALENNTARYNYITGENERISGIRTGNCYNFEIDEPIWHTEFGYSSAQSNNPICSGDDYYNASLLIRTMNQLKERNVNDLTYIYEMSSGGTRKNDIEHNFGIVESYNSNTPYFAKYAYLAVANYNSMTANAQSCNNEYSEDFKFVTKYNLPDKHRDVYMLWTTKENGASLNYSFDNDAFYNGDVCYYDLFGNKLNEADVMVDGQYKLSREPFYAIVGEDIMRAEPSGYIVPETAKFVIKGNLPSGSRNKKISLTVTDTDVELEQANYMNSVLYANQCVSGYGGSFEFAADISSLDRIRANITSEDGERISLIFNANGFEKNNIQLFSKGENADDIDFDCLDANDLSVEVNFGSSENVVDYNLYGVLYKDNSLADLKLMHGNVVMGQKIYRHNFSFETDINQYDKMKIIMLKADGSLYPLCEAYLKEKPLGGITE